MLNTFLFFFLHNQNQLLHPQQRLLVKSAAFCSTSTEKLLLEPSRSLCPKSKNPKNMSLPNSVHLTQVGSSTPAFPVEPQSFFELVPEQALQEEGKQLQIPEITVTSDFEATNPKTTRVRCNKSGADKAGTNNHAAADVIDLDDHHEMGSLLTEDSTINLSKTKVGKYMQFVDQDGYNLLGEYLQKTGNGVPFWECEVAAVYKTDIVSLVRDSTVSSNVIDSFATILGRKQATHAERQTRSHFMPSYCWEHIKDGNYDKLRLVLYDELLKNLGRADFIFFPLTHKRQFHFTLLILKMAEGTWHHYNPLLPRGGAKRDPCFVEAKKLHKEVSGFMKCNKAIADQVLSTGMVRSEYLMDGKPCSKSVPLRAGEEEAFQFLKNANVEFPLVPSPVCPQQHETSVDCGVAVMYFMEHVSEGWMIDNKFKDEDMTKMRARVILCFLNGPKHLEIDYPEEPNKKLDDASVETSALPKRREISTLPSPLPQKKKRTSSSTNAESNINLPNGVPRLESKMKSHGRVAIDQVKKKRSPINKGKYKMSRIGGQATQSQRPSSLGVPRVLEAANKFVSKNPFFRVSLRSLPKLLHIPASFAKSFIKQEKQIVTLLVGDRSWHVTLIGYSIQSTAKFSGGWHAFATDNCLRAGDVCIFELIQRNVIVMDVHIFRA